MMGRGERGRTRTVEGKLVVVREGGWLVSDHDSYVLANERILSLIDRRRSAT